MFDKRHFTKTLLMAAKIGIGSSVAIYLAQILNLDNATSAGTITLLTLMATKWETIKLSGYRLITYFVTVFIAWIVFMHVDIVWISYGLFIFMTVFLAEYFGLATTISVNSVVGAHLLITHDFSIHSIENELILVLIGISVALILNQFQANKSQEKFIIEKMHYTEARLQQILLEFAKYLMKASTSVYVWDDIQDLEKKIMTYQKEAYEYMNNTFHFRTDFYFNYFDMRQNQVKALHNLHNEVKKMREIPEQAKIVAEYMYYLKDFVVERNDPDEQIKELEKIFEQLKIEQLPQTNEEFENRALLYHVLMDIEQFLLFKKRFYRDLNEVQKKQYWS